jgi:hypothetical protein
MRSAGPLRAAATARLQQSAVLCVRPNLGLGLVVGPGHAGVETVKHGETGFLVKSQTEMEDLIRCDAVSKIKSENCIEWARQFSYENMVNRYEELCHEAIDTGGW